MQIQSPLSLVNDAVQASDRELLCAGSELAKDEAPLRRFRHCRRSAFRGAQRGDVMSLSEIKSILVGLDSSPRAGEVLEIATRLAGRFGAKLVLARAVGIPFDFPADALGLSPSSLPGIMEEAALRDLEARARGLPKEIASKVDVRIGTPWQVVCEIAKEENVDLIVIGSHGYSGIDRVIGTTAARVVNHADRSVLVVRASVPPGTHR